MRATAAELDRLQVEHPGLRDRTRRRPSWRRPTRRAERSSLPSTAACTAAPSGTSSSPPAPPPSAPASDRTRRRASTPCSVNAGGLVGNGCVGEVSSPGTSLCGTGRSSIGQTGSPVTRSKTKAKPCLVSCTTASIFLPLDRDRHQVRRRRRVVVPQAVVHDLEVPLALAGRRVEADERLARTRFAPSRRPP